MRRAFTLIELMICIAICAIVAAIAIPNLLAHQKHSTFLGDGDYATVKASGVRVYVVNTTDRSGVLCRIDNGEDAKPRYTEVHFSRDELNKIVPAEKVERE